MTDPQRIKSRRQEQLRRELASFREELAAWLRHRQRRDPNQHHKTQLESLEQCLSGAASAIEANLLALDTALPVGQWYEVCELHALRLLWLRRLWMFFRNRLDQRDDEWVELLLRAADEVIWSAYRPVFETARVLQWNVRTRPPPLPFLEVEYSPAATPASWVPPELRRDGESNLARFLAELPVALVHIPVACLSSPWWLVLVGHEVGHHIQAELGLLEPFGQLVEQVVREEGNARGSGDPARDGLRWKAWSGEIFADVFSVVSLGVSAVRAMAEFERRSERRMSEPRKNYPPAAVRVELLARVAEELELPGARDAVAGLDPAALVEDSEEAAFDLELVPRVVKAALGVLPGRDATLRDLLQFDASQFALAWPDVPMPFGLDGPRRMTSAALQAWSKADDQAATQDALRKQIINLLSESRLPGARAGEEAPSANGAGLANILLGMDRNALGGSTER